jgi:hypothetical protein
VSSNLPYNKEFEIDVIGGTPSVHTLRFPHRGTIRALSLKITGGGGDAGFTAALYAKTQASPGSPNNVDLIGSAITSVANTHNVSGLDWVFLNKEGTPSNPVRRLYLVITPSGTGAKTLALNLMMDTPFLD